MAEALYRKYRPQVFEDMVGQEHIERTLKNAIDQDKVSHAYLFCGPRGTGKTTTARLLAKALLCESGPTSSPDGTCRDCREVADGVHPDVYELDAASRTGVENVREEIIGRVNFAPTRGKKKIYIIDEVHMLSTAAFNALLKTLEEPPSHVVFVLCTTDPQKVPATIHSRCQRFDFHRLGTDEIVSRLGAVCMGEGVEFEGDALALIAHRADGGMRNALTALEQLIAFGDGNVTVQGAEDLLGSLDSSDMAEIVRAVGQRDVAACFNWTAGYVESGADLAQFARDMAQRVRNLYVMSLAGTDVALDVPDAERRELAEELHLFGPDRLARLLALLGDLVSELRTASNPRLCFEVALTRMVRPDSDLTLEALAERIEVLEAEKNALATRSDSSTPMQVSAHVTDTTLPAHAPSHEDLSAQGGSALAATISNPAALQRAWRSVITAVKKERVSYGVLFVNVRARAEANGSGVVLEFPADNPFAFAMASKPEVQEMIATAFQQVVGEPVPCRCVQASSAPSAAAPSAPVPLSQTTSTSQNRPAPMQPPVASAPVASNPMASGSVATASKQPNANVRSSMPADDEVP
ncbi:MAG: DNA polymerase III subunit gamma/tau, partial [Eggerthellaceae bacterium]|nr:DNA polymerase III subunit gamma/tau [Eggerthellaceae bacterium]